MGGTAETGAAVPRDPSRAQAVGPIIQHTTAPARPEDGLDLAKTPHELKHLDIKNHSHHDVSMRTTLTLDDDLVEKLRELSRKRRIAFREVVNDTLRRGLSAQELRQKRQRPF